MTTGDCGVQGHNSNLPHSNQLISAGGVKGEAKQCKQMEKNISPTVMWPNANQENMNLHGRLGLV